MGVIVHHVTDITSLRSWFSRRCCKARSATMEKLLFYTSPDVVDRCIYSFGVSSTSKSAWPSSSSDTLKSLYLRASGLKQM